MAPILVVGADAALLEGVVQLLAAAGHAVRHAATLAEAAAPGRGAHPAVALVERGLLATRGAALPRVAAGGALVLYHPAEAERPPLAARVERATLAEVALPLERHRLLALVQRVVERQQATGREEGAASADPNCPPG